MNSFEVSSSFAVAAIAAIAFLCALVFSAFDRLRHVPGPLHARFVNWGLKYHTMMGHRWDYTHTLHQRYGPIVRITPDEVSVSSLDAVHEIYKIGSTFYKSAYYDIFNPPNPDSPASLFTERNPKLHREILRMRSHAFADKSVKKMEADISRNTQLAAQRMSEEISKLGYTDALKWFLFMATDVIGEASFGESFNMLRTGVMNQYTRDLQTISAFGLYAGEVPLYLALLRSIGLGKQIGGVLGRMQAYAMESIDRYYKLYQADPDHVKPTLLANEFSLVADGQISQARLIVNARGNIIAGSDTTSMTATYATFLLAQNPAVEAALITEIAALPSNFTEEQTRPLSLLDNVLRETLRLCPPVGQNLPRIVPPGGTTLHGLHIPGGSIIGIPAYTLQRDANIFPDPDSFNPSRWEKATPEMRQAFVAFGGGNRICLGMHFAMVELRLAMCHVYRTFPRGLELVPRGVAGWKGEEEMLTFQSFLSHPRGGRCLLRERSAKAGV